MAPRQQHALANPDREPTLAPRREILKRISEFDDFSSCWENDRYKAQGLVSQIQKLVDDEPPKNPLTDQQIVELFERKGVKIARRTVAKYRDQLGILPARMRKRL